VVDIRCFCRKFGVELAFDLTLRCKLLGKDNAWLSVLVLTWPKITYGILTRMAVTKFRGCPYKSCCQTFEHGKV